MTGVADHAAIVADAGRTGPPDDGPVRGGRSRRPGGRVRRRPRRRSRPGRTGRSSCSRSGRRCTTSRTGRRGASRGPALARRPSGSRGSRPSGSSCSRRARSRSPGLPPLKWVHWLLVASFLAYGRATLVLIPLSSFSGGDVAPARAAAGAGRGDPAAGPGAVHQAQVVDLDRAPAAATDRTAARARRRLSPRRRRARWRAWRATGLATVRNRPRRRRRDRRAVRGLGGRADRDRDGVKYGSRAAGLNTRTVSPSAQVIFPATALPRRRPSMPSPYWRDPSPW